MIFDTATPYMYYFCLFLACSYAVKRGSKYEYIGAAIMIIGSVASTIASIYFETTWTGFDTATFYIDMLALLALIYLTVSSDRFWPMWATAFHLVAVSIHVATAVAPNLAPWALATGVAFWAYPMLFALAFGAHEYVRPAVPSKVNSS